MRGPRWLCKCHRLTGSSRKGGSVAPKGAPQQGVRPNLQQEHVLWDGGCCRGEEHAVGKALDLRACPRKVNLLDRSNFTEVVDGAFKQNAATLKEM